MLRGLVISPDAAVAEALGEALAQLGSVAVVRYLDDYPPAAELGRVVRATAPQVAFVSVESMSKTATAIQTLETLAPGIQYIALSKDCDPDRLLDAMRMGIREFISAPFNLQSVHEAVSRVAELIERRPPQIHTTGDIYCFLPAKAGVGASTLALNVSVGMSKVPDTHVVLSDFDMNSGMMRFMLKLTNEYSVADACEHAATLDDSLWPQLVTKLGNLDVLHAGKLNPNIRIDASQIRHLIDFQRRNYQGVVFDLSGNLERYSFEIMQECKRIFLVSTPEIPSLHLAREKLTFLRSLELEGKVSMLVNRCQKRQVISNEQIEQILGSPVHMAFQNDYQNVHKALTLGRWIDFNTELGKNINAFSKGLIEPRPQAAGTGQHPSPPKRKLLEFFTNSGFGGAKAS